MANILSSFHILFESNVDKLKVGMEEAEKAADKVAGSAEKAGAAAEGIGPKMNEAAEESEGAFASVEESIDRFKENTIDAFKEIAMSFIGLFAAEKVIDNLMETAEHVEQLGKVSQELGVNVSDLDVWGRAVKAQGGSVESFTQSLRTLNSNLALMSATGKSRAAPFFKELGINALDSHHKVRPLMDLLPEIAGSFEKLSKVQSAGIGEKLGLDPATILLLQSGRKAVEEVVEEQRKLGAITEHNVEVAEKFEDQWKDTKQVFAESSIALDDLILPALTYVLKKVQEFVLYLGQHENVVKGFFIGAGIAISSFYLPAIMEAAVATVAATWPFLAIGAAVAAFALAYEDMADYLEGKNSLIGELAKKWPPLGAAIKEVAAIVVDIGKTWAAVFKLIVGMFSDPEKAIADFKTSISEIGSDLLKQLPFVQNFYNAVNGFLSKLLDFPNVIGAAVSSIGPNMEAIWQALEAGANEVIKLWRDVLDAINAVISRISAITDLPGIAGTVLRNLGVTGPNPERRDWQPGRNLRLPGPPPAQPGATPPMIDENGFVIPGTGTPGTDPRQPVPTLPAAQAALSAASTSPFAALSPTTLSTMNSKATNVTNNNNVSVDATINTQATDPQAVTKAVGDSLSDHIKNTINHFNDGVQG